MSDSVGGMSDGEDDEVERDSFSRGSNSNDGADSDGDDGFSSSSTGEASDDDISSPVDDDGDESISSSDSDGSSDFRSNNRESSDSDDCSSYEEAHVAESKTFERCLMNFCTGVYDHEIRTALENFAADIPPNNHDSDREVSDDWDTVEDIARHNLKECLQACAREIRSPLLWGWDNYKELLKLTPYKNGPTDGHMISRHHSLRSYWGDISVALTEFKTAKLGSLVVHKIELGEEVLEMLAEKMRGRIQRSLTFVQNNLCSRGIDQIAAMVEGNPTLSDLRICDNALFRTTRGSALAAVRLLGTVGRHPNLCGLSLPGCGVGDNLQVLSSIMNSGATHIILNDNQIGTGGAVAIADFLESNPPLNHLELDKNRFNDDDAARLYRALKKNTNLFGLCVRGNSFTVEGVKTMVKAMFDSSTMNAIFDSNHTCQVVLFSQEDHIQHAYVGYINAEDREASRMRKMKVALWHSQRESLLRYTEAVPVELMPDVISFIQAKYCDGLCNEMVYAIMRWWDMPSLYMCPPSLKSKRKREPTA